MSQKQLAVHHFFYILRFCRFNPNKGFARGDVDDHLQRVLLKVSPSVTAATTVNPAAALTATMQLIALSREEPPSSAGDASKQTTQKHKWITISFIMWRVGIQYFACHVCTKITNYCLQ